MDNNIGNQMMHIRSGTGTMSMWTIFMHADRVDVWLMVFGTIGAMCDGLILPLVVFLLSQVFNNVGRISGDLSNQRSSFTDSITQSALLFCYVGTGAWVVCFLEGYCWTRTGARQAAKMRVKYLKAVLRQDVEYFDLHHTGTSELINTVSTDSLVIQDCISEKIPNFIMNVTTFIGGYIAAFSMLWRLAIVSFPFVILLVIPGLLYGRILMDLARKMTQEYNKAGTIVEQAISSIRTVYAFVGENKTISDFSLALKGTVDLGLKQGLAKGLAIGSNGVIYVVWAFNAWYGTRLVMYHNAQGGTVFAVGAALGSGGIALGSSLANIKYISEAATAADRIIQLINRVPKIDSDNTSGQTMDSVTGEIEFSNVEFAYPSRPDSIILHNFSLTVPARKMVALVGASGSGKSTLVSLLQRYYDPLGGQIFLDAIPINKLQLKWLRSKMGLVSQEPSLFAISIKENILFGKEDATMEEVVQAAKTSNAHNFIMELPQGYDTQVGERGVQLSGGQKQRVAIARAIVRKPPILLLDEATSGMDYESERVVQESIYKVGAGCTSIVIAHRLSTIIHADNIVIIQNGQVMESGSHDKLVCINDGLYSSMIRLRYEDYNKHQPSNPSTLSNSNSDRIDNTNCQNLSAASFSRCTTSPMSFHGLTNEKIHSIQKKTKPSEYPVPSFGRLLALNLQEWKQGAIGCLSATLFGIVHPLYAYMLGSLISIYFLPSHDEIKMKVVVYSVLFLGLFVFSMAVNVSQHYNFSYIGECLTKRIREMLLSKILTFEMGWFDQDENSTGSICSRLAIDAGLVRLLVGDRMALLVQTISATSTAIVMGLVIAWRLTIVLIAIQPLIIVCFYTRRVLLKNMSKKAIKTQHRSSKLAVDAVSNIRLISSFSSQSRILRMLENCEKGLQKESIRQSWYAGIGLGTAQSLIRFTWALYFWYGGNLIAQGYVDAKQLFQTFLIFMGTSRLIADAGSMTSDLAKGADAVHSVFTILDSATQIEPNDPKGYKLDKIIGHVEFNDVDFVYPSRPNAVVFKGFSLSIQAGKSTALVGHSGSGKSTIFALIERFYNPLRGSITVEGRYIQSYNLKSLRKNIALVSQEPTLFATTIRENIAYGLSDNDIGFDESEIVEAAKVANAHDFISGLKDGYETRCGDKGIQLSGGQKQRIAIARAIIRSPSMLLLDEATSALDNQSEKVIQDTIEQIMIGRTSVIVAHRLSTIRDCHSIVVLDKGKVVEKGTHSSLLSKEGPYYSLVCLQRNHNT